MNPYIQLAKAVTPGTESWKKLPVIFGSGNYPYSIVQAKTITRTLTGRIDKQIGSNYKRWYGMFKIRTNPESGYAALSDLQTWMNSEDIADHYLIMRPHTWTGVAPDNVTYNVTFVNDNDPQAQIPLMESAEGFCYVPFELEERNESL